MIYSLNSVASSVDEHARFGGVVPEVASRAHLEAMVPDLRPGHRDRGRPAGVDAVAVTAGPGPGQGLLVGVAAAKAYALALGKPLYGVNHLAAHIAMSTSTGARHATVARGGPAGLRRAFPRCCSCRTWPRRSSRSEPRIDDAARRSV